MIHLHGTVADRPAFPHPAYERYVAVLDVLGMKAWLEIEHPQVIAERLDRALAACDQACSGVVDGSGYGPLLGTTHFSDTLLIWSPDDSWASFATMCNATKLIVAVALKHGIPLRGSISFGNTVCNPRTLRFVGPAIADAFSWSDKARPYRSVGVDITPSALTHVRAALDHAPLPVCWNSVLSGTPDAVLRGSSMWSYNLVWHRECLFVNHWAHGIFTRGDPQEMFKLRGLPLDAGAQLKLAEMLAFANGAKAAECSFFRANFLDDPEEDASRLVEYLKLDQLRLQRHV